MSAATDDVRDEEKTGVDAEISVEVEIGITDELATCDDDITGISVEVLTGVAEMSRLVVTFSSI